MSVKKYLGETSLASLWAKIKGLIPTKTSDLTNDSGFLTSYTETDPTVPSWAKASTKPTYTASEVGAAATSHSHGDITSGGDITATATIANGDRLVINDESASKVTNSSITFGNSTTSYLANNGTWQTPTIPTVPTNVSAFTNDAGYVVGTQSYNGVDATLSLGANQYYTGIQIAVNNLDSISNWLEVTKDGISIRSAQGVTIEDIVTPIYGSQAANKSYVDSVVPTAVSSLTNDAGYLTLATLPIYNGSYSQISNS